MLTGQIITLVLALKILTQGGGLAVLHKIAKPKENGGSCFAAGKAIINRVSFVCFCSVFFLLSAAIL